MSLEAQTQTLPLALMAVLVLLGVAAWAMLYHRKRRLQGAVEEEFKTFRAKAVALMDRLDALRQRHQSLPSTDPDFTAPMSGATLALYNAVEAELDALWERWLQVMELWDQAQKLVRSGSGLAVRQAEEARKLLETGDIDELLRQSGSCQERLDRPPTWKGAAQRAGIAAVVFGAFVVILFGRSAAQAVILVVFMFLLYIPLGYATDNMIYRFRQRRKQAR